MPQQESHHHGVHLDLAVQVGQATLAVAVAALVEQPQVEPVGPAKFILVLRMQKADLLGNPSISWLLVPEMAEM
jgi:hypothetical protein